LFDALKVAAFLSNTISLEEGFEGGVKKLFRSCEEACGSGERP
jgi:hypothetical protein